MPISKQYKTTRLQKEELQKRLAKIVFTIIGILVFTVSTFTFFAPKVGSFFGLFSVHRNDKDPLAVIKPSPPLFSKIPSATKEDKITINGYSQSGMTITLYVNGPEIQKTTVGNDGLFTFNDVTLINGANTIFAKTTDSENVQSDSSTVFTVMVDKEKPKLDLTSPKDGDTVRNLDKRITIIGKVNEKSSIKVNDKMAILRPDMTFEFLLGATDGNNKIKIEVTDEAGNVTTKELTVNYQK